MAITANMLSIATVITCLSLVLRAQEPWEGIWKLNTAKSPPSPTMYQSQVITLTSEDGVAVMTEDNVTTKGLKYRQGRVYQPRVVGWNNPSRCKGDLYDFQSASSCSQTSDDTKNNPGPDQFHASFRGIITSQSGDAALRLQLKIGEGMPPMEDPFAPAERDTNIFWSSHFKGDGLKEPNGR